jgi:hypothetical protein
VDALRPLCAQASALYTLPSYTTGGNDVPVRQMYGAPGYTADMPLCTYTTPAEVSTVRISMLLPHLAPMQPYAPSAMRLAGVRDHLRGESMSIEAALLLRPQEAGPPPPPRATRPADVSTAAGAAQ